MDSLIRHDLTPAETGAALRALSEWTPPDAPMGGLHPGDVGWQLRLDEAVFHLWASSDSEPVAVGFLDGPVLRVTAAPGADPQAVAAALLAVEPEFVDGAPIPGWQPETDAPWLLMSWAPRAVSSRARPVEAADVADRVRVQRSAFDRSTFTVDRWHTMMGSPAGELCADLLVRTPSGEPAAAATGWFAGPGRCGLLEPVGTHQDHRGHGYGRDAVLGACAALADRGASAVAVATPSTNEAAVALYRSAGFTVVRETRAWVPAPPV